MRKYVKAQIYVVDGEMTIDSPPVNALRKAGYKVTCFNNPVKCLEKLRLAQCNVLISDVKIPQMDGLKLLKNAHRIIPGLPVILISEYQSIPEAVSSMKMGAADFLTKPINSAMLLRKVSDILSGKTIEDRKTLCPLTKTEKKILKMVLAGKSNIEIANDLQRSTRTVEYHKSNIMSKYNVDNTVDLVKKAFLIGF